MFLLLLSHGYVDVYPAIVSAEFFSFLFLLFGYPSLFSSFADEVCDVHLPVVSG